MKESPTVRLVPLSEVTQFARDVKAMLNAQDRLMAIMGMGATGAEFKKRLAECRDRSRRVLKQSRQFLSLEKQSLPMFEEEGGRDGE